MKAIVATTVCLCLTVSGISYAATWCGNTSVKDVICYSDGSCYVTADAYGGVRAYHIAPNDVNKNAMVATALTAFASDGEARLAFAPDGLNCSDIPVNTDIWGVGATRF